MEYYKWHDKVIQRLMALDIKRSKEKRQVTRPEVIQICWEEFHKPA